MGIPQPISPLPVAALAMVESVQDTIETRRLGARNGRDILASIVSAQRPPARVNVSNREPQPAKCLSPARSAEERHHTPITASPVKQGLD